MKAKIYYITNHDDLDEIPLYIGKTKNDLITRKNQHNIRFRGNFRIFEIDEIPEEEWKFWEKYYVSLFKTWGFKLWNNNEGGGGPSFHPEKVRKKMRGLKHPGTSIKLKGRKRLDTSLRFKGKIYSEEHRNNISLGKKGHKCYLNPKRAKKIIKSNKEHYKKNSLRNKKISKKLLGRKAEWLQLRNKSIIQYNLEGKFIREWESGVRAGEFLKKNSAAINECCNGKRKTAYGYRWKFKIAE